MTPIIKAAELERKARVFALFSDPTRIQILKLLASQPKVNVTEIADQVGMSVACISHHLQLLKDNKIAQCTRQGNTMFYCLIKDPLVKSLIKLI